MFFLYYNTQVCWKLKNKYHVELWETTVHKAVYFATHFLWFLICHYLCKPIYKFKIVIVWT